MIRGPRRNIAQRFSERQNAKTNLPKKLEKTKKELPIVPNNSIASADPNKVPLNIQNVPISKLVPPPAVIKKPVIYEKALGDDDIQCIGPNGGKLYPKELWQLHQDMDAMAYHKDKLSEEALAKLEERMPMSMAQAEQAADRMLKKFVQNSVNNVGPDVYSDLLKHSMSSQAQIMLALRCFIASSSHERKRDQVVIYKNTVMGARDFFPKDCERKWINPKTQREETYFVDRPGVKNGDKDDVYWRSANHSSNKHHMVQKFLEPPPSKQDKLPESFKAHMQFMLETYGIKIETAEEAWRILDSTSRASTIEDRILSRIAYLVTNASVQRRTFRIT